MTSKKKIKKTIKLIFNPHAGKKRKFLGISKRMTIQNIQELMERYQMPVDLVTTKGPGHATELARNAKIEGYEVVVVAGGDGTVNEAANGLIGSDIPLGIIPIGSFMNIARMLSIPNEIERAIALLKIRRLRKIDVGMITKLDGEKMSDPFYFLETSSIGLEAHIHYELKDLENGDFASFFRAIKYFFKSKLYDITIKTELETFKVKTNFVMVANGPISDTALKLAPDSKLNDHRLSILIYKMKSSEIAWYFLNLMFVKKANKRVLKQFKATSVTIDAKPEMFVHANAILFGTTPVVYKVSHPVCKLFVGFQQPKMNHLLRHGQNLIHNI